MYVLHLYVLISLFCLSYFCPLSSLFLSSCKTDPCTFIYFHLSTNESSSYWIIWPPVTDHKNSDEISHFFKQLSSTCPQKPLSKTKSQIYTFSKLTIFTMTSFSAQQSTALLSWDQDTAFVVLNIVGLLSDINSNCLSSIFVVLILTDRQFDNNFLRLFASCDHHRLTFDSWSPEVSFLTSFLYKWAESTRFRGRNMKTTWTLLAISGWEATSDVKNVVSV